LKLPNKNLLSPNLDEKFRELNDVWSLFQIKIIVAQVSTQVRNLRHVSSLRYIPTATCKNKVVPNITTRFA